MTSIRFLLAGPLLSFLVFLLSSSLPLIEQKMMAVLAWVMGLWIFTSIPLGITALSSSALAALLGVAPWNEIILAYSNPVIFLFMGGFFLAKALEAQGLDLWFAHKILNHPWGKKSSGRAFTLLALGAFVLSMGFSNVASTAIFLPIAVGLLKEMGVDDQSTKNNVLLMICHATTLGGITTPVGTAPNVITIGLLDKIWGVKIEFAQWIVMMMPLGCLFFIGMSFIFKKNLKDLPPLKNTPQANKSEALTIGQKRVFIIFLITAILWIAPGLVALWPGQAPVWALHFKKSFPESMVAILGAVAMFALPDEKGRPLLDWHKGKDIDWGSLLLFGAGIALGDLVFKSGLATRAALALGPLNHYPLFMLLVALIFTMLLTEFCSNTATVNLLIPIVLAMPAFKDMGVAAVLALSMMSNTSFMMPVGTPPNAMVYGTGRIRLSSMIGKGVLMNLMALIIVYLYSLSVFKWFF